MQRDPLLMVALQIHNQANGGIESFTQVLTNLKRYRPVAVTNVENARTAQWREAGIETHVIPYPTLGTAFRRAPLRTAGTYLAYTRSVARLAKKIGTRLVYTNDPLALQLIYWLARTKRIDAVFNMRSSPDPALRHSGTKYRQLYSATARNLFLSHEMAAIWGRLSGASPEPYSVTYSPVAAAYLDAPRTRDTDKPFVLLPGRITPAKRQLEFLNEVSPALAASGIATVIAGDAGPAQSDYEDACRKAAAPLQEFVRFLGYCPDMLPLYSSASVVVIPSRFEGLSRAMIEGMACGCPVVSFDVCSAHEILDEGAGLVVPQLDWVGMTDATLDLCGEARNNAVGSLGRAQARRLFDPVDVIDRYEQAFDAARTRR